MSTKIYQAWKFPIERLNDFVSWYDGEVFPKIKKHFDFLVNQLLCSHPDDKITVFINLSCQENHEIHSVDELTKS